MGGGAGASEGREEEEMNHWILLLSSVPLDSAMFIFPIDSPRCWPRLGEAACARLCGPDPSPPRNWRSCAVEKSHGWLREKRERKEQQSPIAYEQNLNNTSRHTTHDQDRWVDYSTNWTVFSWHDDISISRDTHIHMSGSYFTSKSYFAVWNFAVCEKSSKIQYIL